MKDIDMKEVTFHEEDKMHFVQSFSILQGLLHLNAVNHGWWDEPKFKKNLKRLVAGERFQQLDKEELDELNEFIAAIPDYNDAEKIALMHSELSESLEGIRGDNKSDKLPGFTAEEEELADVLIRAMDYSGKKGLRLAEAVLAKAEYNLSRPYKHGNKNF